MPRAEDLTPDIRFVALFVGPKHSGKTVAAASFEKPVEFYDFDGRIRGLLGAPWLDRKGISYIPYLPKEPGLVTKINNKLGEMINFATMNQFHIKTGVLDSLTSETYAMLTQSVMLTHNPGGKGESRSGRYIGPLAMSDPGDYGFEAQATYDIIATLRSLPFKNLICTAHVIDKYGKSDPDNPYSDSVVIGEKLSLRDKINANLGIYFDHIFRFERKMVGQEERFFVQFRGPLACTSYAELPTGTYDITGKNFYDFMNKFIKKGTIVDNKEELVEKVASK